MTQYTPRQPNAWQRAIDRHQPPMLQFNYSLSSDQADILTQQQVKLRDWLRATFEVE